LFGLSTGRDVNSVRNLLEIWGIDGLVDIIVGTGGAEIYDYILDIEKANYPLDGELIKDIMKHYKGMNLNFTVPYNGILYATYDDHYIQALATGDRVPYEVVDFNEFLEKPKAKLMIVCHPDYMDEVIERSKTYSNEKFKSSSLKTCSDLYEYMDPRVTKTNGLIEALGVHEITLDQVCTFGDADNDNDGIGKYIEKYVLFK